MHGSAIIAQRPWAEPDQRLGCITSGTRTPLEDDILISRAKGGDDGAFEELVLRYQEAAFRAAFLVLRDAAEAEDAAQEGFMKVYRAIGGFKAGSAFRPWLLKIVINQALTMAKSSRRRTAMVEELATKTDPMTFTIDEAVVDAERARLVWSALEALREQERVVVYLRYFLALPEKELAEYLGCAPGTVKSRLHRALQKLRDVILKQHPQLSRDSL